MEGHGGRGLEDDGIDVCLFRGACRDSGLEHSHALSWQPQPGNNLSAVLLTGKPNLYNLDALQASHSQWHRELHPHHSLPALSPVLPRVAYCLPTNSRTTPAWPNQWNSLLSSGWNHSFSNKAWFPSKFVFPWILSLSLRVQHRISFYLSFFLCSEQEPC